MRTAILCLAALLHPGAALAQAPETQGVNAERVAAHLAGSLRFPTVSHQDPADFDGAPFLALHAYLQQTYPRAHDRLEREVVGDYSLLFRWPGRDPALAPALFMSHLDVVPVETATLDRWSHPPFDGVVADGFVWGRGALDQKVGVIVWLEAVEALLAQGFEPERTIYLSFGHDEEIGGRQGASAIASLLAERGVELEFLVDEGGFLGTDFVLPDRLVATVNTAEKGYVTLRLTARGEGGHSSMPPPHTAVGKLATAIHRLEANPFPLRITEPVYDMLQALAPEMPLTRRLMIRNLWLTGPLVKRGMAREPQQQALLRTTTAATLFNAGLKENLLPKQARASVNFRLLPGDTAESVAEHARRAIADEEIEIEWDPAPPPPRPASVTGRGFGVIRDSVLSVYPEALVVPGLLPAGTDTRHFDAITGDLYRFIPVLVNRELFTGFHGTDERLPVDQLEGAVEVGIAIVRGAAAAGD